jgi:hypothetical protein
VGPITKDEHFMTTSKKVKPEQIVTLDANPEGKLKGLAGAEHDDWNLRLINLVAGALPDQRDAKTINKAINDVCSGMLDMKPRDPIEGILIAQIFVAHEAAMKMFRFGWLNNGEGYLEASTRYLALADKAVRTTALLIERLDQHRGRGQQQITVKHVTVNVDQAVVTDQIVTDKGKVTIAPDLLTARTDKPMEIIEPTQKEVIPVQGEGRSPNEQQPHAQGSRSAQMYS